MQVYRQIDSLPIVQGAVVTIGTFDGVHKAHQKIIRHIKKLADKVNGQSVIVTFHPHPRLVIRPDSQVQLLTSLEEKLELLAANGVDHALVVPFNREFSEMTAESYVKDFLLDGLRPHTIVIGYDHRFGLNRTGDINLLREIVSQEVATYGKVEIEEIKQQTLDELTISSTRIREALSSGDVKLAAQLIGYHYKLNGIVIKGFQIGRQLGYPTANLLIEDEYKLVPADGIYAVRVKHADNTYGGMLSIGFRPTFEGKARTIEVNIFDFEQEIYGERVTLEFIAHIRSEEKFGSKEELIAAMARDKLATLEILSKLSQS